MLDFVVKLKVLVCRPAAPRRTSARPAHKHAQSRRFADGPRCRGGHQVRTSGAASPRDWPGEARPRSRPGRRGVERCFWRRSPRFMACRWRHVTLRAGGGQTWSRGRFQPEKAPHGAAGCLFGARRRSCLARSISNAYQVATKRRGVVRACWRAHRNEFSPVLSKIQDSARTATLPWLPSLSVRFTLVVRSVWRPTTR